jgi:hypothetical protein
LKVKYGKKSSLTSDKFGKNTWIERDLVLYLYI